MAHGFEECEPAAVRGELSERSGGGNVRSRAVGKEEALQAWSQT